MSSYFLQLQTGYGLETFHMYIPLVTGSGSYEISVQTYRLFTFYKHFYGTLLLIIDLSFQFIPVCVTLENTKLTIKEPVTGNLCLIHSICFSGFDPEKSFFHMIANNLNGFLSFDGLPNALNRR